MGANCFPIILGMFSDHHTPGNALWVSQAPVFDISSSLLVLNMLVIHHSEGSDSL